MWYNDSVRILDTGASIRRRPFLMHGIVLLWRMERKYSQPTSQGSIAITITYMGVPSKWRGGITGDPGA